MTLPDITPREHEVAAAECEAIAAYHDRLAAGGLDGSTLAAQHRMDAQAIRSRGMRHLELAQGLPRGSLESGGEETAGA